jgi:NTP pyrophosphatase (non-canonical NTP hydrolase)
VPKGKAGKYTKYSESTGITKHEGQSTLEANESSAQLEHESFAEAIPDLSMSIRQFAKDRAWEEFHKPRNLLLALTGELGELAELFQWKGDHEEDEPTNSDDAQNQFNDKVAQEIADVAIYLLRLADVCGVSLKDEMDQKK